MSISEHDWKVLRKLKPAALERLCERILRECCEVASADGETFHERYLKLYEHIRTRDAQVAAAFDDLRRSRAIAAIAEIHELELLEEGEFLQFSEETRETVLRILGRA